MIKYLGVVLLIYILYFIYFRIKYRFWSRQPVFHKHNLFYWIRPIGIIQKKPPSLKKFFNKSIISKNTNNLSIPEKHNIHKLIHSHYLSDEEINYAPSPNAIFSYLESHNDTPYISMFYTKKKRFDYKNKQSFLNKHLLAVMTSRPLNITLNQKTTSLHYVDFLCIHRDSRGKRIAPQLIFTHQARVRNNSKTQIFLFKRETKLSTIVPLTTYYTYGFDTKYWNYPTKKIADIFCILANKQNFYLFEEFIQIIKNKMLCTILPHIGHIQHLINQKLIKIYILLHKNKPIACYVFRKPFTTYHNKDSLDLIISFFLKEIINPEIFYYYFKIILEQIQHPYIIIENIGYNSYILQKCFEKYVSVIKAPTAYYFYNFAHRPILSNELFILL